MNVELKIKLTDPCNCKNSTRTKKLEWGFTCQEEETFKTTSELGLPRVFNITVKCNYCGVICSVPLRNLKATIQVVP